MSEDRKNLSQNQLTQDKSNIGRRGFVATAAVAGLAACSSSEEAVEEQEEAAAGPPYEVVETDVEIPTADGVSDSVFIHPEGEGIYPGVIIWPDAFGLRPTFRAMGRRVAAEGYSVLVANPYYRMGKAPTFTEERMSTFDFGNTEDRAFLTPLMGSITAPGAAETDAAAYVAFLDSQPQVDAAKGIGTQGYCMGGPLIVRTAAAQPDRIAAAASFHGGGLVNDTPNSPHLLAPKTKAQMYFGIAANDDASQPEAKDVLKEAWGDRAEVEVYPNSQHGWCVMDMPAGANGPIYNEPDAERAWGKLIELYSSALS